MSDALSPVLVVGGCGFVGQHIISELLRQDPSAAISVLDLYDRTNANPHPSVTYYSADITKESEVKAVFEKAKPRTVFHTVSPHPLQASHDTLYRVNLKGTQNLLWYAREVGAVAFIYTSSASVVHDHRTPLHDVTEAAPVLYQQHQPEYYSYTKAVAETLVLGENRSGGMLTVSIRPATIYGEHDLLMTAKLCLNAKKARYQFGNTRSLMDVTYAGNLAHAEILAAKALVAASSSSSALPLEERVEGEAFFVRNDERYEFWEVNRMAAKIAGHPVQKGDVKVIPLWFMMGFAWLSEWLVWGLTLGRKQPLLTTRVVRLTTIDRTFSIDKIKARLGYHPRFTTEEGMERAVGWYMREVWGGKSKTL